MIARVRRLLRQLVVDPVLGIAGSFGVYPSPSATIADAIRRGLEEGEADYRQWKAENPAAAARWEADLAAIQATRHRGR